MKLHDLLAQNPIADPILTALMHRVALLSLRVPARTKLVLEGEEHLPTSPVIFAPNHTHKYDFLPLRALLLKRDLRLVTWIKSRAYKDPIMAKILGRTGNIPLASKGYLIAADFESLLGRRPQESEYRRLREHVEAGAPLPDDEVFEAVLRTPREMLGFGFHPARMSYREAQRALYVETMQGTLRLARRCVNAGHHMHFYPQGAVSSRLTPGKIGLVSAALALRLPIIPVGVSGCREIFVGESPRSRGGTITMRIGEPVTIDAARYGEAFRPFHPDDEDRLAEQMQADVDGVMARINALLDPQYQWAEPGDYDGRVGIDRFY